MSVCIPATGIALTQRPCPPFPLLPNEEKTRAGLLTGAIGAYCPGVPHAAGSLGRIPLFGRIGAVTGLSHAPVTAAYMPVWPTQSFLRLR